MVQEAKKVTYLVVGGHSGNFMVEVVLRFGMKIITFLVSKYTN